MPQKKLTKEAKALIKKMRDEPAEKILAELNRKNLGYLDGTKPSLGAVKNVLRAHQWARQRETLKANKKKENPKAITQPTLEKEKTDEGNYQSHKSNHQIHEGNHQEEKIKGGFFMDEEVKEKFRSIEEKLSAFDALSSKVNNLVEFLDAERREKERMKQEQEKKNLEQTLKDLKGSVAELKTKYPNMQKLEAILNDKLTPLSQRIDEIEKLTKQYCTTDPNNPICQTAIKVLQEAKEEKKEEAKPSSAEGKKEEEEEHKTAAEFIACPTCGPLFVNAAAKDVEFVRKVLEKMPENIVVDFIEKRCTGPGCDKLLKELQKKGIKVKRIGEGSPI